MAVQTLRLFNDDVGPKTFKSRALDTYHLQAWIYPKSTNTGTGTYALVLNCTDSRGVNGPTTVTAVSATQASVPKGAWYQLDGYATVPTGYDTVDPAITFTSVPVADTIYVDDVLVRESTIVQNLIGQLFGSNAIGTAVLQAMMPQVSVGGVYDSFQNHLQNIIDFSTQGNKNSASSGNSPSQMKNNLLSLPVANVAPPANPSGTGNVAHGANSTPAFPSTTAFQYTLNNGGTLTPLAADNWVGGWAVYQINNPSGTANYANYCSRSASFGSVALNSISGPILIERTGGLDFYMEYWGGYIPLGSAAATASFSITSGTSGGTYVGYVQSVYFQADSYSGVIDFFWQGYNNHSSTGSYSDTWSFNFNASSMVISCFVAFSLTATNSITTPNHTQRTSLNGFNGGGGGAWFGSILVQDAIGALSETFTATQTNAGSFAYGGGIALIGQGTIPIGSYFHSAVTSTSAITSASGTNLMPSGTFPAPSPQPGPNCTADFSYSATNNVLTVKNAGEYVVSLCYSTNGSFGSNYILGPVLFKNGSVYEYGACTPQVAAAGATMQSTFIVKCAAGDTLQPGYYSTYISTLAAWAGEATGTKMYFDCALANRGTIS